MKKMIIAAAIMCAAVFAQAAQVAWSVAGMNSYAGDAYSVFVIGQNGVKSVDQITALLDAGTAVDSYAFGSGTVAANGMGSVTAAASGKTLDAGTHTMFAVLFDSASPSAGNSQYVTIAGQAGFTKAIAATTASVTFAGGNVSSVVNNAANWKSFGKGGGVPEPTSGLLLLVGGAMLALRRKQK